MPAANKPSSRGRPRSISPERIIQAGIDIGLSEMTFVGVAAALGVSHMALYKHVSGINEIKYMVAEEIFNRWQIPEPEANQALKDYLLQLSDALRALIKANIGLTPYLLRRVIATPAIKDRIQNNHQNIAAFYALELEKVRALVSMIAFHCIAVAATMYSVAGDEPISDVNRQLEEAEMEAEFSHSIQALIIGGLNLLIDTKKV